MIDVEGIRVLIRGDATALNTSLSTASRSLTSWGSRMQGIGTQLSARVTAPLIAIGAAAAAAANSVDEAMATIRAGTGATGEALASLGNEFRSVAQSVPNSMGDVATAIADVNTRTGQTGAGLRELSTQMLNLSRLTGSDVSQSVESVTRVFGDWGIATADQTRALNYLWRTSQTTGASVEYLSRMTVQYGAPLRQLGYSFEQAGALIGKWNREGVNTEAVLGGMRQAIAKLSTAGVRDLPAAFRESVRSIRETEDSGRAAAMAMNLFGARAGADLAAAIREGRFEIDNLVSSLSTGTETINSAGSDTLTLGQRLSQLGNRIRIALEPIGSVVVTALESMMPLIQTAIGYIQRLTTWFAGLGSGTQTAALAMAVLAAAVGPALVVVGTLATSIGAIAGVVGAVSIKVVALGAVLAAGVGAMVAWYRSSKDAQETVQASFESIRDGVSSVVSALSKLWQEHGDRVVSVLSAAWGQVSRILLMWGEAYGTIIGGSLQVAGEALQWFSGLLSGETSPTMRSVIGLGRELGSAFGELASALSDTLGPAFSWLYENALRPLGGWIADTARNMWSVLGPALDFVADVAIAGLVNAIRGMIAWLRQSAQIVRGVAQVMQGDWSAGMETMADAVRDMGKANDDAIGQMNTAVVASFNDMASEVTRASAAMRTGVVSETQAMADEVVGHSIVPDMSKAVVATVTEMKNAVVSVAHEMNTGVIGEFDAMAVQSVLSGKSMAKGVNESMQEMERQARKTAGMIGKEFDKAFEPIKTTGLGGKTGAAGKVGKLSLGGLGLDGGLKVSALDQIMAALTGADQKVGGLMQTAGGLLDIATLIPGLGAIAGPLSAILKSGAIVDAGKAIWGGIKKLKFWADGGVVTKPIMASDGAGTQHIIGEAGPEAIIPLPDLRNLIPRAQAVPSSEQMPQQVSIFPSIPMPDLRNLIPPMPEYAGMSQIPQITSLISGLGASLSGSLSLANSINTPALSIASAGDGRPFRDAQGRPIQINVEMDGYRVASVVANNMQDVIGVAVR